MQMTSVDERYKPEYDLHLIKLLASYYGVPIAELGFTEPTGLGNASWHEGQAEVSGRLGLRPDTAVVTDVINALSRQFLKMPPELEGAFVDPAAANTAERETVIAGQRGRGSISMNEERAELGQSLLDFPEADMYWMATPTGPIFIQGAYERAQQAAQASQAQAQAQVMGTAGKLEIEHKRIEDGQAARAEGRDFAREQFQAQQDAGIEKTAEISAYRNWSRKHPEDEPRRPFIFKHVTPDDDFPELEGIGPWRVQYEGWEWLIEDEITKSVMSWLEWNLKHPNHPRDARGRWVKADKSKSLPEALHEEGKRTATPARDQSLDQKIVGLGMQDYGMREFRQHAKDEGIDTRDLRTKKDLVEAIYRHHAAALDVAGNPRHMLTFRGERKQQIEADIRAAYARLKGRTDLPSNNLLSGNPEMGQPFVDLRGAVREGGGVFLADIRDELGEKYGRQEIDDVLTSLISDPSIRILPIHAQSILMPRDRDSQLHVGGRGVDYMHIYDPSELETDTPRESYGPRSLTGRQRDIEIMALHDELRFAEPGSERHQNITEHLRRLGANDLTLEQRRALERIRPANLPDEPGDRVFQAQVRQAKIDVLTSRAKVLAEIEELHFINQGGKNVQLHRIDAHVKSSGLEGDPHMTRLREAIASGDSERVDDALTRAERELGLERIGGDRWLGEDQMVAFDLALHKPLGKRPTTGQWAYLVRPGHYATVDGERVLLAKARVQPAEPDEIARFKELSKAALVGGVGPKVLAPSGLLTEIRKVAPDDQDPTVSPEQPPVPPDQRWPGWLFDALIAAVVTALLLEAMPSLDLRDLLARFGEWSKAYRPGDPMPDVRQWITRVQPELQDRLEDIIRGPIQQAHVEGWLVGQRSAEAVLEAVVRGEDPREVLGFDVDWGDWTPGHRSAAEALLEPGGLERLLYQSNVMIKSIANHRLDQIGRILGEGIARGDTPEEIARTLRERVLNNRAWAHRIAITETNRAMSYASVLTYRDSGMAHKGWITAFDQTVCAICLNNEWEAPGIPRIVPIDQLFPSGDPWPPAHPHCRCAPIPVVGFPRDVNKSAIGSAMSWIEWNVKHPTHPRINSGRFGDGPGATVVTKLKAHDFTPHLTPEQHEEFVEKGNDPQPPQHVKDKLTHVFSGAYDDFRVDPQWLTIRYSDTNEISVKGIITDEWGGTRGSFERVLREESDGTVWAHHEFLKINDPDFRGQGFARAFNARAEAFYREVGVTGVKLEANIDVGGYAWARAGYDWDGPSAVSDVLKRLTSWLKYLEFNKGQAAEEIPRARHADQAVLARKMIVRLKGDFNRDDFPTPYEVSQLGRWRGAGRDDVWVGKAAMLGSNWNAVKYLETA